MPLLRIRQAAPLKGLRLRLTLTNGTVVERDLSAALAGPIFDPIRSDPRTFAQVRVEGGTVVWPNGADLCPDVLIWNGPPPQPGTRTRPPKRCRIDAQPSSVKTS